MKLIFIYGAPASGKLTIAKALSEKIGYKLFHNHLTVDPVKEIFEFGTQEFWDLVHKLRLDIFEAAVKQNIPGMIFTYVYEKDSSDDKFIKQVLKIISSNGGECIFIHISCSKETLLERVTNKSREKYEKVKTKEGLLEMLNRADFISPIPFVKNNQINNTNLTIEETVKQVMKFIE